MNFIWILGLCKCCWARARWREELRGQTPRGCGREGRGAPGPPAPVPPSPPHPRPARAARPVRLSAEPTACSSLPACDSDSEAAAARDQSGGFRGGASKRLTATNAGATGDISQPPRNRLARVSLVEPRRNCLKSSSWRVPCLTQDVALAPPPAEVRLSWYAGFQGNAGDRK